MQLLLLEDDVDLGQAVAAHLRAARHTVHWCRSIAEALAAPVPELALLDLHLPDGDGLALLRQWRAARRRWPVIVLTARDQVSDRIRGLQAGADDYLVKPFDLNELLARVDAVARRLVAPQQIAVGQVAVDDLPAQFVGHHLGDARRRQATTRFPAHPNCCHRDIHPDGSAKSLSLLR